jgi:single-stranded-DNA-specific exonuclease
MAMYSRWKLKPVKEQVVQQTADLAQLPAPIARALALRVEPAAEAMRKFLQPRLSELTDPGILQGMQRAVSRIWQAIADREPITVFGDYDVDGVTATALMIRILGELDADVKPFIPDRLDEGYGLSLDAVRRCLEEQQPGLIITVDCGSNSGDSVSYAKKQGVDVIVTDHHELDAQPADAYALINPKQTGWGIGTDPADPFLEILSGAGLAFKLAHALLKAGRTAGIAPAAGVDLREYLDLVALGTVTDIVPLTGENRIIVRHGLEALQKTKWEGLRALKTVSGIRGEMETYHLGYQLGPRINAAGRIGQPLEALRLLLTDDTEEARRIAGKLNETNTERRRMEKETADAVFAEIDAYFNPQMHYGLVIAGQGWHPGVVGIVASRVARHYNRPAIVLGTDEEGCMRGSCRSIDEFDILEGLHACGSHLITFGGHRAAAGVQLAADSLDAFRAAFNAAAASVLQSIDLHPVLHIDAVVSGSMLDRDFLTQLKQLRPFGEDNPEPVWVLHGAEVSGRPRVVGNNHLKLSLCSDGCTLDAIAFSFPRERLPDGPLDVAFTLKENCWNGNTHIQLHVRDIRRSTAS